MIHWLFDLNHARSWAYLHNITTYNVHATAATQYLQGLDGCQASDLWGPWPVQEETVIFLI